MEPNGHWLTDRRSFAPARANILTVMIQSMGWAGAKIWMAMGASCKCAWKIRTAPGKQREELGELEGRAYKPVNADENDEGTTERVKVEWAVKGKKGSKVNLVAKHEWAGTVRVEVVLK